MAAWDCGAGRTMAYTCDCAPHWASPELCNWKHYSRLWQNIVHWLARA
ncbi:MAG: glutamine amidotransferase [Aristaeellaceae bacterium]